jgi:alkylhydroperoxidase family enzyme
VIRETRRRRFVRRLDQLRGRAPGSHPLRRGTPGTSDRGSARRTGNARRTRAVARTPTRCAAATSSNCAAARAAARCSAEGIAARTTATGSATPGAGRPSCSAAQTRAAAWRRCGAGVAAVSGLASWVRRRLTATGRNCAEHSTNTPRQGP